MASISVTSFIVLQNSSGSVARKFRVPFDSYEELMVKSGRQERTVTGQMDNQTGPIARSWRMTIRAWAGSDPDNPQGDGLNYGTKADLETFFTYNNPQGSPSNVLSLWLPGQTYDTDTPFYVYLVGSLPGKNMEPDVTAGRWETPVLLMETTAA